MGIFKAALQLKVATVTADTRYEFVLYPLGTTHTSSGAGSSSPEDARENSWQYASLHSYAVASVARNHPTDVLVRPNNFLIKSPQERVETSVYTKFIIATKKEQLGALPNAIHHDIQRQPLNSSKMIAQAKSKLRNHDQATRCYSTSVPSERPQCLEAPRTQNPAKGSEIVEEPRIRSIRRNDSLDNQTHTTKSPPTCAICGTEFAHSHSLNRHLKSSELSYCTQFKLNPD